MQSDGKVLQPDGPVGFSAAVQPYLAAINRKNEERSQTNRLDASLDPDSGLYGRGGEYYDQNLAMFSKGWTEQRFRFDRDGRVKVKWRN